VECDARVYQTAMHDVIDLKQHLLNVWVDLDQRIIDKAVAQWRRLLRPSRLACKQKEKILNIFCKLNKQTKLLRNFFKKSYR